MVSFGRTKSCPFHATNCFFFVGIRHRIPVFPCFHFKDLKIHTTKKKKAAPARIFVTQRVSVGRVDHRCGGDLFFPRRHPHHHKTFLLSVAVFCYYHHFSVSSSFSRESSSFVTGWGCCLLLSMMMIDCLVTMSKIAPYVQIGVVWLLIGLALSFHHLPTMLAVLLVRVVVVVVAVVPIIQNGLCISLCTVFRSIRRQQQQQRAPQHSPVRGHAIRSVLLLLLVLITSIITIPTLERTPTEVCVRVCVQRFEPLRSFLDAMICRYCMTL